jgi:hypothetical protein
MNGEQMHWLSNPINRVWLALVAATLTSYMLGEQMVGSTWHTWAVVLVFGLALAKGVWVIDVFMGLRTAPALWRRVVLGWLMVLILALVLLNLNA